MLFPFFLRRISSFDRVELSAGAAVAGILVFAGCAAMGEKDVASNSRTPWTPPAAAVAPAASAPRLEVAGAYANGQPLDLIALTDLALANGPQTRLAWLAAKSAAAQRLQAGSAWLPQVAVGFSRQEQALGSLPGLPAGLAAGGSRSITYGPTYSISQLIYDFGGVGGASAAAREALYAANFGYNQTLQDTALAVVVNYYQTIASESGLEAAKVALEDAKTGYELAKTRSTVGLAARGDMLRAESNLRSAEFQVDQQVAALEQSRASLSSVIGLQITPDLKLAPPPAAPAAETFTRDIAALTNEAITRRPDLQAAQATVRAREESVRASRAGYRPSISTSLSGQRAYLHGAPDNPSDNWTFSLNLNWNIFDGFNTPARVAAARVQVQSAKESLRQQEIAVVADVWAQYYALQSATKQVASARAGVAASTEAFQLVEQGYRSGLNSLTDFLAAQRDLAQARLQRIQAETGLAINLARMAHATGALEALPSGLPPKK
jgi:outer membrane protein